MPYNNYLKFDQIPLPLPTTYDLELSDVEAESSGQTEAGTTQRDIVRVGVVAISVSFKVTAKWLSILSEYANKDKIQVAYFDTTTLAQKETEMYISGYKVKLEKDTSYKSLWSVSFSLKEF